MKEIFKKIANLIQNGMKGFLRVIAQEVISEEVIEVLHREKKYTAMMNDRTNAVLLKSIVNKCPKNHFIVLATDENLFQGCQEARNLMRAHPERAFISASALGYPVHSKRPITPADYQTAYALNPSNYSDKVIEEAIKCFKGKFIAYFDYASF